MKRNQVKRISFRENTGRIAELKKHYDVKADAKAIYLAVEEVLLKLQIAKAKNKQKDKKLSMTYRDKNKQYTVNIKEEIFQALLLFYNTKNASEAVQRAITDVLEVKTEFQKEPKELKAMYFMFGRKNKKMCNEINSIFEAVKGSYKRYCEAFVGTGNVFYHFNLDVNSYLNDKEPRTINFLRVLRDKPLELKIKLMLLQYNEETFNDLKNKSEFISDIDDAVNFLFTRYASYKGLGKNFNKHQNQEDYFKNLNLIYYLSMKLQGVEISKTDALYFINKHNETNVLLYSDSPYPYTGDFYKNSINHKKLARLLQKFKGLFVYSCRITFSNENRDKGYTDKEMELTIDALYSSKGFYYKDVKLDEKDENGQIERLITNFNFPDAIEYK